MSGRFTLPIVNSVSFTHYLFLRAFIMKYKGAKVAVAPRDAFQLEIKELDAELASKHHDGTVLAILGLQRAFYAMLANTLASNVTFGDFDFMFKANPIMKAMHEALIESS